MTLPQAGAATVNIVGNGNDFYGVDLTLSFEPGSLNIREIREGGFLSRDGQIVAFVQRMETDAGMVRISIERPPGIGPFRARETSSRLCLNGPVREIDASNHGLPPYAMRNRTFQSGGPPRWLCRPHEVRQPSRIHAD